MLCTGRFIEHEERMRTSSGGGDAGQRKLYVVCVCVCSLEVVVVYLISKVITFVTRLVEDMREIEFVLR